MKCYSIIQFIHKDAIFRTKLMFYCTLNNQLVVLYMVCAYLSTQHVREIGPHSYRHPGSTVVQFTCNVTL